MKARALAASNSLTATSCAVTRPSSIARARAWPMAPSPTMPTWRIKASPWLHEGALEDDVAIEGGDGLPELILQRRFDLGALGELAAEIDQSPQGSNQVPLVSPIGLVHQPRPVLLA